MKGVIFEVLRTQDGGFMGLFPLNPAQIYAAVPDETHPDTKYVQVIDGQVVASFKPGELICAPIGELP